MSLPDKLDGILISANLTAWDHIRMRRDALLDACDWAVMPDSPLSEQKINEFKSYRQALRDVPQDFESPEAVVWPSKPSL